MNTLITDVFGNILHRHTMSKNDGSDDEENKDDRPQSDLIGWTVETNVRHTDTLGY